MNTSSKHIDFIINHTQKISDYYAQQKVSNRQFFALGLLQRLNHSCQSLKILLKEMQKNPSVEFSIGLILRALILDFLINLNLQKIIREGVEKKLSNDELEKIVDEYCNESLADGLKQVVSYIKSANSSQILTEPQMKEMFNAIKNEYGEFFQEQRNKGDAPVVKHGKFPSANELFTSIAKHKMFSNMAKIYDSYQFFSKYDHFGILYFHVIKTPFEDKMYQIANTIELLLGHLAYICHILTTATPKDEFIKEQFHLSSEYLKTLKNEEN